MGIEGGDSFNTNSSTQQSSPGTPTFRSIWRPITCMPLVHLCLPPQIELSNAQTCDCVCEHSHTHTEPILSDVQLYIHSGQWRSISWRPDQKLSAEALCPLIKASIYFSTWQSKVCRWESFYQTSPWTDHMSTTPLPEATVHMCHYPTWPVFGSTHGSEAKRETAAALPISYEIMAAVHWVVLLCLTTLPEPIMAPMNRKRAGVQGFLFLHEDYHQNMHLTTVWKLQNTIIKKIQYIKWNENIFQLLNTSPFMASQGVNAPLI